MKTTTPQKRDGKARMEVLLSRVLGKGAFSRVEYKAAEYCRPPKDIWEKGLGKTLTVKEA